MIVAGESGRDLLARACDPPGVEAPSAPMTEREFEYVYRATSGPLLGYLLAVTGRRDLADDLLQEAYVRLLAHPHPAMDLLGTRRYVFRVAANLLRDRWRRREDAVPPEPVEASYTPDLNTSLHVHLVLQQLKPRQRELLWLAYVEGMDHREIATVTGLGRLSIRMLLSRARKQAGALLAPERSLR